MARVAVAMTMDVERVSESVQISEISPSMFPKTSFRPTTIDSFDSATKVT